MEATISAKDVKALRDRTGAGMMDCKAALAEAGGDVPEEDKAAEQRIFEEQAAADGKPADVQQKIAEGRMRKWLDEVVLLRQTHVNEDRHGGKTIEELRTELAAGTR